MNAYGIFIIIATLLFVVDLPWLWFIGDSYSSAVKKIQGGRDAVMSPIPALIVYPALAYLVLKAKSVEEAFWMGAATYAVYDFTVLAVFKDYPLYLAVGDTLWGGTLFAIVYTLKSLFLK
jgi:uncharacterized membrane protein